MRAALLEKPGASLSVVDDVDIADPGPGQVRVRVTHCGLCHSDVTVVDSDYAALPVVLGHEAAGVVDAVGDGVASLAPGDKVVLTPIPSCGRCHWCVRSQPTLCVQNSAVLTATFPDGSTGLSRQGATVYRGLGVGAFAEHVLTNENGAVKVADDTPLEVACVIGCAVQTGVGAVFNTAAVEPGSTVLVLGLGGIGQSIVQGAVAAGAATVIASDPVAERREAARRFGATHVVDPDEDDVAGFAHGITGVGVDYAFEAVGRGSLVETALASSRAGGLTVCVGAPPLADAITISPAVGFVITEKRLAGCFLGSCNSQRDIPRLLDLWRAGRLDLAGLITARRPLDGVNEAFDDLRAGRGIRTVLELSEHR